MESGDDAGESSDHGQELLIVVNVLLQRGGLGGLGKIRRRLKARDSLLLFSYSDSTSEKKTTSCNLSIKRKK